MYTITSGSQSESFALHGLNALTSYQADEADLKKTWPGQPLIANHAVRRRLVAATPIPVREVNLESVATLVEDILNGKPARADISSRSWFCNVSVLVAVLYHFLSNTHLIEH